MKRFTIALILVVCLICILILPACSKKVYKYESLAITVCYRNSIEEPADLTSERDANGSDFLYVPIQEVKVGDVLTPPTAPTRSGYIFSGWTTVKDDKSMIYDFSKPITGSMIFYAYWEHATGDTTSHLEYSEPTNLAERFNDRKIDDSTPFTLTAICNQPIKNGEVKLTTVGINRLTYKKDNVNEYLSYTRASSTTVKSAVYADGKVSVTYVAGGAESKIDVTVIDMTEEYEVKDNTATQKESIDETTFETKAKRYEDPDQPGNSSTNFDYYGSYEVIMGGSSSMENWSDSSEYMSPATTKNVGIGGSSAEYWLDYHLADRLIIPFNPRAVVLYVGINDIINYHYDGKRTAKNLTDLFKYIHERLPQTTIHYILINKVPEYYTNNKEAIDYANTAVEAFAAGEGKDYMNIIDAGPVLEKKNGEYSWGYFTDGLHMSKIGYELWGAEVKESFVKKEKELYE